MKYDLRLLNIHKWRLCLSRFQTFQKGNSRMQASSPCCTVNGSSAVSKTLYNLAVTLDFLHIRRSQLLLLNFHLQKCKIIIHIIAIKFLHLRILQMEDLVEAMIQKIAVVGDHKQCSLMGIDQIPKCI